MSQTLNNITMLAAFGEITKSDAQLQDYVAKTASYLAAQGKPFREVPELFTETLMAERLDILKSSHGGQEFARKIMNTDLSDDLEKAGISRGDLSKTEVRQLQITKIFKENFSPERPDAFSEVLKNARENLYGHLQSSVGANGSPMEGRSLPPSIVYSMAFGEGRGFGVREPDEDQLKLDMWDNKHIQETVGKVVEAHDAFYESQGMKDKTKEIYFSARERISETVKEAGRHPFRAAATLFFTAGLLSMMSLDSTKQMDTKLAHNILTGGQAESMSEISFPPNHQAYTVNIRVDEGQTASEMASSVLKAIGVPATSNNIGAMLEASSFADPDVILKNTIEDLKLPVTGELTPQQTRNLLEVADNIAYGGNRLITSAVKVKAEKAFLDNLSSKKGEEYSM